MIRLSATQIDSYLKYEREDITEDMLISTLLRLSEPSLKMTLGSEFHSLLEKHDKESPYFDMSQVQEARSRYNTGVFEIKERQLVKTKHGTIVLTGIADNLIGKVCNEFKTAWGSFSIDRYMDSVQWQIYCLLFGCDYVNYAVFEFPNLSTTVKSLDDIKEPMQYRDLHEFKMYDFMIDPLYVFSAITRLTKYVQLKGFENKLQYIGDPEDLEFSQYLQF